MRRSQSVRTGSASSGGFTLIEIAFAIIILAGALVSLLGLQSASIQRAVRDANNQQAMLIARQIFSAIETTLSSESGAIGAGEQSGPPDQVINQILAGSADSEHRIDPEKKFTATMNVSFWPLPNMDPNAVKRIHLTISWSDRPEDSLSTVYFVPSDEQLGNGGGEDED